MKRTDVTGIANMRLTTGKKKISFQSSQRWPEIPRYYGLPFARWAICAELRQYGYVGVDAFGEIQKYEGRLWRRWSDVRRKKNLALIYSFAENLPQNQEMYFCTLTVKHPKAHTYSGQKQAIEDIRAAWILMMRYFRRIEGIRYLRMIEAGSENGYAHIHMIVSVPSASSARVQKIPEIWVRSCRKIGNEAVLDAQNLQRIDSTSEIRNIGAYISKYLSKTLESSKGLEDTAFWKWMEVCYRLRLRCVSMDSDSRAYIKQKYAKVEDIAGVHGTYGGILIRDVSDSRRLTEEELDIRRSQRWSAWRMYLLKQQARDLGIDIDI